MIRAFTRRGPQVQVLYCPPDLLIQVLSVCKIMCKTSFYGSESYHFRSRCLFLKSIKRLTQPVGSYTK